MISENHYGWNQRWLVDDYTRSPNSDYKVKNESDSKYEKSKKQVHPIDVCPTGLLSIIVFFLKIGISMYWGVEVLKYWRIREFQYWGIEVMEALKN